MSSVEGAQTVSPEALRRFCQQVLEKLDLRPDEAALVAEQLIESDLRGIDTHGIMRLPVYAGYLAEGYYNARPNVHIVNESAVHALFDADRGMGFIASTTAMQWCIDRAKAQGFGMAGVRNSRHNGASASYAIMAANENLIGFAATNVIPIMAPPGSPQPTHGNNPICFAMPRGKEPMLVMDMATSVKAWGNVLSYRREDKELPAGWALDKDGNQTHDPNAAISLVPIGEGGYKGFGLALVLDVLCGVMTGSNFSRRFDPTRLDENVGHFFFAIDPSLFMPLEEFEERLDESLHEVRSAPPRDGVDRIYIPGEIEAAKKEATQRDGIRIPPGLKAQLEELGSSLGVEFDL